MTQQNAANTKVQDILSVQPQMDNQTNKKAGTEIKTFSTGINPNADNK